MLPGSGSEWTLRHPWATEIDQNTKGNRSSTSCYRCGCDRPHAPDQALDMNSIWIRYRWRISRSLCTWKNIPARWWNDLLWRRRMDSCRGDNLPCCSRTRCKHIVLLCSRYDLHCLKDIFDMVYAFWQFSLPMINNIATNGESLSICSIHLFWATNLSRVHVLYLSGWSLFVIAPNSFNSVPESDMLMTAINTSEI